MEVLKFSASWCGPCKQYLNYWNEVKSSNKNSSIHFKEIDVDIDEEDLVTKYGIRNVPTTVVIDNDGNPINRFSGVKNTKELESFILNCINS